jgi:hypothetical protein
MPFPEDKIRFVDTRLCLAPTKREFCSPDC